MWFHKLFTVPPMSPLLSQLTSNVNRWCVEADAAWLKQLQHRKIPVMNRIQIQPLYSFHLIERNQVNYECLCSSASLYAVDQRARTVTRWSREGKWKTRAEGTESTMKTFSCEGEPGMAALGIQETSLLFLKALRWLGLTLHGMTPVQMLRVVRGAYGSSQTLDPFITITSSGCTIMESSRK